MQPRIISPLTVNVLACKLSSCTACQISRYLCDNLSFPLVKEISSPHVEDASLVVGDLPLQVISHVADYLFCRYLDVVVKEKGVVSERAKQSEKAAICDL